jgi:hypothetical protein
MPSVNVDINPLVLKWAVENSDYNFELIVSS